MTAYCVQLLCPRITQGALTSAPPGNCTAVLTRTHSAPPSRPDGYVHTTPLGPCPGTRPPRSLQNALSLYSRMPSLSTYSSSRRVAYAPAFLKARAALVPQGDSDRARLAAASAASARAEAAELPRRHAPACPSTRMHHSKQTPSRIKVRAVTGPCSEEDFLALTPERITHLPCPLASFEHLTHMCLAAPCGGREMEECLALWARAQTGTFSSPSRTFRPGPFCFYSKEYDWSSIEVRTITPEQPSAGIDVVAQPSWASSECSW